MTRTEKLLTALINGETVSLEPQSRIEMALKNCCEQCGCDGLPEPQSRIEVLLHILAEKLANGGGGGNGATAYHLTSVDELPSNAVDGSIAIINETIVLDGAGTWVFKDELPDLEESQNDWYDSRTGGVQSPFEIEFYNAFVAEYFGMPDGFKFWGFSISTAGSSDWGIYTLIWDGEGCTAWAYNHNPSGDYGIPHGWEMEEAKTIEVSYADIEAIKWLKAHATQTVKGEETYDIVTTFCIRKNGEWVEFETGKKYGETSILEGDGQDFHQFAPTALTFRSQDNLEDFQEVQINGETLDPANYTLTEGSTIVTLSADYLKTLEAKTHEISIVSTKGKTSANFSVTKPELNVHNFYYNQPYSAEVPNWGRVVFFIREDGTYDMINGYGVTSTNTYTVDGNSIVALDDTFGAFHCTVSSDGTEIYCAEVQTALKISNDTSFAADEDYFYVYNEELGGYEVRCIDKTKAEYGAIKTGINGIDTVKLADKMFYSPSGDNYNLKSIEIPDSVVSIGDKAFKDCTKLVSITFGKNSKLKSIGSDAFSRCASLTNITIPDSVVSIGENAFNGAFLRDFQEINGSVSTINSSVFMDSNIRNIMLGYGITHIGSGAFQNCTSLRSIEIPTSVVSIDTYAFYYCMHLMNITYTGTISQWLVIEKGADWDKYTALKQINAVPTYRHYTIHCSDGDIDANGNVI